MAIFKSRIDWHDLRIAPDDIPEEGEDVLVTVELLDGTRKTRANVYLKELENDTYCWCEKVWSSSSHMYEEAMVWYEVTAWAYYPEPCLK